jgi:nitroreductase
MIKEMIKKNRSYRRFYQKERIDIKILKELVELARLSPSSANLQPLKFILSAEPKMNSSIFPHLAWAGYLKDWNGPKEGERPSAYIVILGDTNIGSSFGPDSGIAAQSILLGAVEKGLGGCIIGSIDRERLRERLNIPKNLEILLVIALGRPKERVVIKDAEDGNIKYYRDRDGTHYVPKRRLEEIIIVCSG